MSESPWGNVPDSIDSFELPDMTDGARGVIADNAISDEDVMKIEGSGANGKIQKNDVESYVESLVEVTEESEKNEKSLVFPCSGWCEELGKSYFPGPYLPGTKKEYEALKPFAK